MMARQENGDWPSISNENGKRARVRAVERLDSLLPADAETGVATFDAVRCYLGASMEMMARHGQPLTLLVIAPDPSDTLRRLGVQGGKLIGAAVARALRQESRVHDVVGLAPAESGDQVPSFLIIVPFLTEAHAGRFAERLRQAMTILACDKDRPWLTISAGIASMSLEADAPETLIRRGQRALQSAQRSGGSRVWSQSDSTQRLLDGIRPDSTKE